MSHLISLVNFSLAESIQHGFHSLPLRYTDSNRPSSDCFPLTRFSSELTFTERSEGAGFCAKHLSCSVSVLTTTSLMVGAITNLQPETGKLSQRG